jgi:hypothetical protein
MSRSVSPSEDSEDSCWNSLIPKDNYSWGKKVFSMESSQSTPGNSQQSETNPNDVSGPSPSLSQDIDITELDPSSNGYSNHGNGRLDRTRHYPVQIVGASPVHPALISRIFTPEPVLSSQFSEYDYEELSQLSLDYKHSQESQLSESRFEDVPFSFSGGLTSEDAVISISQESFGDFQVGCSDSQGSTNFELKESDEFVDIGLSSQSQDPVQSPPEDISTVDWDRTESHEYIPGRGLTDDEEDEDERHWKRRKPNL